MADRQADRRDRDRRQVRSGQPQPVARGAEHGGQNGRQARRQRRPVVVGSADQPVRGSDPGECRQSPDEHEDPVDEPEEAVVDQEERQSATSRGPAAAGPRPGRCGRDRGQEDLRDVQSADHAVLDPVQDEQGDDVPAAEQDPEQGHEVERHQQEDRRRRGRGAGELDRAGDHGPIIGTVRVTELIAAGLDSETVSYMAPGSTTGCAPCCRWRRSRCSCRASPATVGSGPAYAVPALVGASVRLADPEPEPAAGARSHAPARHAGHRPEPTAHADGRPGAVAVTRTTSRRCCPAPSEASRSCATASPSSAICEGCDFCGIVCPGELPGPREGARCAGQPDRRGRVAARLRRSEGAEGRDRGHRVRGAPTSGLIDARIGAQQREGFQPAGIELRVAGKAVTWAVYGAIPSSGTMEYLYAHDDVLYRVVDGVELQEGGAPPSDTALAIEALP